MLNASVIAFLNQQLPPEEFWCQIKDEVAECIAGCAKVGIGHVIMTRGPETRITREHVAVLLDALADGKLPLEAASYIADALILSDDFEWDDDPVAVALFSLSDDSRPLTQNDIAAEKARLSAAA